jgi:hypothetical protein
MRTNTKYYLAIILGVMMICLFAAATVPEISSVFAKYTSYGVESKLFYMLNDDRMIYDVHPVMWDGKMANIAYSRAVEVANADTLFKPIPTTQGYLHEDIFIVPVNDFDKNFYYSPQTMMDIWRNGNNKFRLNELNRDNLYVGIGVVKTNGNYYVVIEWR